MNNIVSNNSDLDKLINQNIEGEYCIINSFNLDSSKILPKNVKLSKLGDSIVNLEEFNIVGNNTIIDSKNNFLNIGNGNGELLGSWLITELDANILGLSNSDLDQTKLFQKIIDFSKRNRIHLLRLNNLNINIRSIDLNKLNNFEIISNSSKIKINSQPALEMTALGKTSIRLRNSKNINFIRLNIDCGGFEASAIGVEDCENITIEKGEFYNSSSDILKIQKNKNTRVLDNVVYNTTNAGRGIWIGNSNKGLEEFNSVVSGNIVKNCDATGIVFGVVGGVCSSNEVYNCKGSGIIPTGTKLRSATEKVVIENNILHKNIFHGIQDDSKENVSNNIIIRGNICYENRFYGIVVFKQSFWNITGNICYDNGILNDTSAGIRVEGGSDIIISSNNCYNNSLGIQKFGISIVSVNGNSLPDVNNISITGNICSSNKNDGIALNAITGDAVLKNVIISANVCENNGRYGLAHLTGNRNNNDDVFFIGNISKNNRNKDVRLAQFTGFTNNIFDTDIQVGFFDFPDGEKTPNTGNRENWRFSNDEETVILDFKNKIEGKMICFYSTNLNTIIKGRNFIFKNREDELKLINEVYYRFKYINRKWREI